jgi:hypothetical protein
MADTPSTTNSNKNDAEKLARLLELELIQKRTAWKRAAAHYQTIRLFGFLFLFILIVVCAGGFFFVFSRVNPERTSQRAASTPTLTKP